MLIPKEKFLTDSQRKVPFTDFQKKSLTVPKAKLLTISPLQMKVLTKSGKVFTAIAINEVSLLRQTRQTASLQIKNSKKISFYVFDP